MVPPRQQYLLNRSSRRLCLLRARAATSCLFAFLVLVASPIGSLLNLDHRLGCPLGSVEALLLVSPPLPAQHSSAGVRGGNASSAKGRVSPPSPRTPRSRWSGGRKTADNGSGGVFMMAKSPSDGGDPSSEDSEGSDDDGGVSESSWGACCYASCWPRRFF